MDTYHVVLFIHLLALFIGIGGAALVGVCLFRLRAAKTLADAVPWGMLAGQTEKVFPIAILGLFGSGAYMTSDVWTWGTRWIDVSIAALVVISLQGPLVAGTRAKLLERALHENGPGPLGERARAMTRDRALWIATLANPALVLGVVWNMTQKPGTAEAIAAVAVAYAVGAAAALIVTRMPARAPEAATVSEPAA
jgi:hypothetical protein